MTTSSPKSKSPQKGSSPTKAATTGTSTNINSPTKSTTSPVKNNNNLRPSAEDLVDLERELQKLISRKIQADTNLVKIETRLFDLETEYLTETQSFGNLIHGIEGYLGLPPATATTAPNGPMRRGPFNNSNTSLSTVKSLNSATSTSASSISPQQRIFSSTSTTYQKSLATAGRLSEAIANGYVVPTEGNSHDLSLINGIRSSKNQDSSKKSSSPTKKSASSNNSKPLPGVNKNKKASDSAEWQPPSMKASRKK